MTIEGAPWFTVEGDVTLSRLPRPGWVLVSSETPPAIPGARCVDVRPGGWATFDGDRFETSLLVEDEMDRRHVDRRALHGIDEEVRAALRGSEFAVVRFGDRATCRRALPDATVATIERRLRSVVEDDSATLVTWTGEPPRNEDYRTYDVVIEGPNVRFG